jgi:hypothetical protein
MSKQFGLAEAVALASRGEAVFYRVEPSLIELAQAVEQDGGNTREIAKSVFQAGYGLGLSDAVGAIAAGVEKHDPKILSLLAQSSIGLVRNPAHSQPVAV